MNIRHASALINRGINARLAVGQFIKAHPMEVYRVSELCQSLPLFDYDCIREAAKYLFRTKQIAAHRVGYFNYYGTSDAIAELEGMIDE